MKPPPNSIKDLYRSSKFAEEVESSQSWTIGSDTAQMIGRFKRGKHTSENNGLMDDNLVVILYNITMLKDIIKRVLTTK